MATSVRLGVIVLAAGCLVLTSTAVSAQARAAAERAAQRAASKAAEKVAAEQAGKGAVRSTARNAAAQGQDRLVKRWTLSLCKPAAPCPLPEHVAKTFVGGSYDEVILGADTVLYRAFHDAARKFGAPGERFSYWSRSEAQATQAVIDRAIDVSKYGNTTERVVAIKVPKGTRIFEGRAQAADGRGPVGGGNQVVVDRVDPRWETRVATGRGGS